MAFFYDNNAEQAYMAHVRPEFVDRVKLVKMTGEKITAEEYSHIRCNSYEQKYLEPYLSDHAFISRIEGALKQVRVLGAYELPVTYNDYLQTDGVQELLQRFKEKI